MINRVSSDCCVSDCDEEGDIVIARAVVGRRGWRRVVKVKATRESV